MESNDDERHSASLREPIGHREDHEERVDGSVPQLRFAFVEPADHIDASSSADVLRGERAFLMQQCKADIQALDRESGPLSEPWRFEIQRILAIERQRKELEYRLGRGCLARGTSVYPLFMLFLFIADIPLNRLALEFRFDERPLVAMLLAMSAAGCLLVMAHVVGKICRESTARDSVRRRLGTLCAAACVFLFSLSLVALITAARVSYLINVEEALSIQEMFLNAESPEVSHDSLFLWIDGGLLAGINVAIIVAGILLSYFRHDPIPYFERLIESESLARLSFRQMRSQYVQQKRVIVNGVRARIRVLNDEILRCNEGRDRHRRTQAA